MKLVYLFACLLVVFLLCGIGCRPTSFLRLDAEVEKIYSNDSRLYHLVKIVNTGHTDETVLTANNIFSVGGNGDESCPYEVVYGLGLGRQVDTNGYVNVYSPYLFDPVTIHPGEYTDINTGEKDILEWLNSKTGTVYIIFRYEVTEDWGKRLDIWHGRISSPLLKVDFGSTNMISNKASEAIGVQNSPQPQR